MQAYKGISKFLFFRDLPANGAIFSKSTPFVPRFKNRRHIPSVQPLIKTLSERTRARAS